MRVRKLLLAVGAFAATFSASTSYALVFSFHSMDAGTAPGTQARSGFEAAAYYWSSVLTDNVTVNLNIGFSALGGGTLGSTSAYTSVVSMQQYYAASKLDAKTMLDAQAVANLRPLGPSTVPGQSAVAGAVSAITNNFANGVNGAGGYTDASTRIDSDGGVNNSFLGVTTASAKALGITTDANGAAINYANADASIQFSNTFSFDFNPTDGIDGSSYDFIGVAIHEIGHALGFLSGVDTYDAHTAPGQTNAGLLSSLENSVVASQLDLYRYSSTGNLDWSTQNTPYFSIDGGQGQFSGDSQFSTGVLNGDSRQASHWKDSAAGALQLGILDPTSSPGQMLDVTALDLAAFDAIGWDSKVNVIANPGYRFTTAQAYNQFLSTIPEPSSWSLMLVGFGAIGVATRQRRPATRAVA